MLIKRNTQIFEQNEMGVIVHAAIPCRNECFSVLGTILTAVLIVVKFIINGRFVI